MLIRKIKSYLLLLVFSLILVILLLPFYKDGKMISGLEGAYFLDFPLMLKNYGYSWSNWGTGIFTSSLNFGYVFHLSLLQRFIQNERLVNFAMIYSLYFLSFLAVYLLSLELKLKPWIAFLISIFYVTNPFTANFLKSINQWNMLAAYILPAFFLIILKFYEDNWKLFFFFGIHSLFFAFTNANPPTMILYQIAIIFFIFFVSFHKEQRVNLWLMVKKYFLILSSFILFNFWWIINWFYIFYDAQQGYSKEIAISVLRGSGQFIPALWRTLNFTSLFQYPLNPEYDYFARYYSSNYAPLLLAIPILIVIYFLFKKGLGEGHHSILGLILLLIGFLVKGVYGLFGGIYEFMVMNLPFFSIFKSAAEKWGTLFIFLLTLYLIFIFRELKKDRLYSLIVTLLTIYILYSAVPFITGNFLPDYKYNEQVIGSKRFLDKAEYQNLKKELNNDPEQYRILSLPGSWNYQIALQIEGKRFYTGNDPVLSNINKPFIAPYNGAFTQRFGVLFDSISKPEYLSLVGLYNIKKIVINKDMYPWFGFQPKESVPEMEEIFDKEFASSKNEVIDLYDIGDYYLPRFYVPKKIIYSPTNRQDDLPDIVSTEDFSRRTAIFLDPNSKTDKAREFENELVKENSSEILLVGDIQSAIDEARLRTGVEGMNPGGVLFPYVRWKPGSFIYPYIQKKEQKIKNQVLDKPELLLEQHLFFAAKRISEIQKWDVKLDDKQFREVLEGYKNEMREVIRNLNLLKNEGKDTFPLLVKIEVSFEAHNKRLLDVLKGDYFGEENERVKFAKSILNGIDNQLKNLIEKEYLQTRYYFNLSQESEYEILAKRTGISSDWKIENVTPRLNERFVASLSAQQNDENWLSFGRKQFAKGKQFLAFIKPQSPNLLAENWKNLEDYSTVYQDIKNWGPEAVFNLSFKYKTDNAQIRVLLVEKNNDKIDTTWFDRAVIDKLPEKTSVLLDRMIESENEWKDFGIVIKSGRNIEFARLFISSRSDLKKLGRVEFKDVKIETIVEPKIILRKVRESNYPNIPQITLNKINPTKYMVDVENATTPYFLVFSESFHRGWKTYIKKIPNDYEEIVASYFNGEIKEGNHKNIFLDKSTFETWDKKPLAEDRHIVMNGYANSWFITPEDTDGRKDYQIIIEYWPQKLFYIGAFITVLTIFTTLIVGLFKIVKSSKRSE